MEELGEYVTPCMVVYNVVVRKNLLVEGSGNGNVDNPGGNVDDIPIQW